MFFKPMTFKPAIDVNDNHAAEKIAKKLNTFIKNQNVVFVCIGTDRATGDSYGPLVGKFLSEKGYNVIGTLDDTCNATNLKDRLTLISQDAFVIAVDACLGKEENVGTIAVKDRPLKPGAGINKVLPEVGNLSIEAVVNVGGYLELFVLQNTRLSLVWKLAETTVKAIELAIPAPEAVLEVATA